MLNSTRIALCRCQLNSIRGQLDAIRMEARQKARRHTAAIAWSRYDAMCRIEARVWQLVYSLTEDEKYG